MYISEISLKNVLTTSKILKTIEDNIISFESIAKNLEEKKVKNRKFITNELKRIDRLIEYYKSKKMEEERKYEETKKKIIEDHLNKNK